MQPKDEEWTRSGEEVLKFVMVEVVVVELLTYRMILVVALI